MPLRLVRRCCHDRLLFLATGAWLLAVGIGFLALLDYACTPGRSGTPAESSRADGRLHHVPGRASLVMLAHPHCPCTRASIDSLARIMSRCQGLVTAHVVFYKPAGFPPDWERTDLWHSAAAIPGVTVSCDEGGEQARSLGATTSGHVLLHSPDGVLLFSGGITVSRGHEGDNAGMEAVNAHLTGHESEPAHCPVYGCPLQTPPIPSQKGDHS